MAELLIEFRGVSKSFGPRQILDQVNLEVFMGQTTTIIGKSGTGKSVLLKLIIGLLDPDEGTISFRGKPISKMTPQEKNDYRSQINFCFQNNALFDSLTVFENIALPLRKTTRLSPAEIQKRVRARIEQMELDEVPDKYPADLSGGMQKRVALARALITDPKIVLFDEPTTGQDPIRKNAILSMIAQYQKKFGFTTIMVSHELPDVFFISDRILVLYDRGIIFQGDFQDLQKLKHPMVDEFIQSLEGVRDELTGLHSRHGFKSQYQKALGLKKAEEGFAVIVFSLQNMDYVAECFGPISAQTMLQAVGTQINNHFSNWGISNRSGKDQFTTILPTASVSQAEQLLGALATTFKEKLAELQPKEVTEGRDRDELPELKIMAGLAEAKQGEDIDVISRTAIYNQIDIAGFLNHI